VTEVKSSMGHRTDSAEIAVDNLSRRFRTVLTRYFARHGIGHSDSQDLAQDVFLNLSKRDALASVENVEGYLFAAAANAAREFFRRHKVRNANPSEAFYERMHRTEEFTPERLLEGKQELAGIVAALNEMPERMRNIFILARLENMDRGEIAVRLGISKRLVEQQITLATACLSDRRKRLS